MTYDREIIKVLTEAGHDGLSLAKIVRHVYNASNTLFETVDFEDVYRYVFSWLQKNSKSSDSLVEKAERGIYRLNLNSNETSQLMLQFTDAVDETKDDKPQVDLSLSLFD